MNIGKSVLFQLFIGQHGRAVRRKLGHSQKRVPALSVQFFPRGLVAEELLRFPVRRVRAGGADVFFVEFVVLRRLRFHDLAAGIVVLAQIFFRLLQLFSLFREFLRFRLRGGELGADNVKSGLQVFRGILRAAQGRENFLFRLLRRVLQSLPHLAQITDFQAKLLRFGKAAFPERGEILEVLSDCSIGKTHAVTELFKGIRTESIAVRPHKKPALVSPRFLHGRKPADDGQGKPAGNGLCHLHLADLFRHADGLGKVGFRYGNGLSTGGGKFRVKGGGCSIRHDRSPYFSSSRKAPAVTLRLKSSCRSRAVLSARSQAVASDIGFVVRDQRPDSSFSAQPTALSSSMSRQTTDAGSPAF